MNEQQNFNRNSYSNQNNTEYNNFNGKVRQNEHRNELRINGEQFIGQNGQAKYENGQKNQIDKGIQGHNP